MKSKIAVLACLSASLVTGHAIAGEAAPDRAPANGTVGPQVFGSQLPPGPGEASRRLVSLQYSLNCDAVANLCYGTFLQTTAKQHFDFRSLQCHVAGGAATVGEVYFRFDEPTSIHIIDLTPKWVRSVNGESVGDYANDLTDFSSKGVRKIEAGIVFGATKPRYAWCNLVGELATDA